MIEITKEKIVKALNGAGNAHHEYQEVIFGGANDKYWPGFYAAYLLGSLGDIVKPSILTRWLEESAEWEDWGETTANVFLERLKEGQGSGA